MKILLDFDLRHFTNLIQFSENKEKEVNINVIDLEKNLNEEKKEELDENEEKNKNNEEEEIEEIAPQEKRTSKRIAKKTELPKKIQEQPEKKTKRTRKTRARKANIFEMESPHKKIKQETEITVLKNESLLNTLENEESSLLKISINFNNIFKLALKNLFNANWEKRHSSCLILKAFLKENYAFLGFHKEISLDKSQNLSKLQILTRIQTDLQDFNNRTDETERKTMDILTRILIIVALDRFGDFLFEKVIFIF